MSRLSWFLMGSWCALLASGCSDDDDERGERPAPDGAAGALELSWSIDGQRDAALCERIGATDLEVAIFDEGFLVGEFEAPCGDFEARLELLADDYLARSTLVNARDVPVTRRVVEDFVLIEDGLATRLSMDFPSDGAPMPGDAGAPSGDGGLGAADAGAEMAPAATKP